MARKPGLMVIALLVLWTGACGGSKTSPSPTSPTPSPSPSPSPTLALGGSIVGFDNTVLSGATVEVTDGINRGKQATANSVGRYLFSDLQAGSMTLEAKAAGYQAASSPVSLTTPLTVDFQLDLVPAEFIGIGGAVKPLAGRPAGTYGASIANSGAGCALKLAATGKFLDRLSQVIRTLSWSAPATTLFKPGDTANYEFCCILDPEAAQIANVVVDFTWLNRPCS